MNCFFTCSGLRSHIYPWMTYLFLQKQAIPLRGGMPCTTSFWLTWQKQSKSDYKPFLTTSRSELWSWNKSCFFGTAPMPFQIYTVISVYMSVICINVQDFMRENNVLHLKSIAIKPKVTWYLLNLWLILNYCWITKKEMALPQQLK